MLSVEVIKKLDSLMKIKIYHDHRGGKCEHCGATISRKEELNCYSMPYCENCNSYPTRFRIRINGKDYRHSHDQTRLTTPLLVLATLLNISKSGFLPDCSKKIDFAKPAKEYLTFHKKRMERGEITIEGMAHKKKLFKNQIYPFFKRFKIGCIDEAVIRSFKDSQTQNIRSRDKSLAELKTFLRWCHKNGVIDSVPKFDPIASSRKRRHIMSMLEARQIISKITYPPVRPVFNLLTTYPLRPCEVVCLKWENIDFKNERIVIDSHVSMNRVYAGRKSQPDSRLELPLTKSALAVLMTLENNGGYVFKNKYGDRMSTASLRKQWNRARSLVGLSYDMYELRGAKLSELSDKLNGDLIALKEISGHSSTKTLADRYVRNRKDISKVLEIA